MKSAIELESDPVKLAQIFESSSSFPHFRRHRPLFHYSVRKLARSNRLDLVDQILNKTLQSSPPSQLTSEGFWLRFVMLYSEAGMLDNALQVTHSRIIIYITIYTSIYLFRYQYFRNYNKQLC